MYLYIFIHIYIYIYIFTYIQGAMVGHDWLAPIGMCIFDMFHFLLNVWCDSFRFAWMEAFELQTFVRISKYFCMFFVDAHAH